MMASSSVVSLSTQFGAKLALVRLEDPDAGKPVEVFSLTVGVSGSPDEHGEVKRALIVQR
jgi:hypothetical protein